jgi:hypothetical protein
LFAPSLNLDLDKLKDAEETDQAIERPRKLARRPRPSAKKAVEKPKA